MQKISVFTPHAICFLTGDRLKVVPRLSLDMLKSKRSAVRDNISQYMVFAIGVIRKRLNALFGILFCTRGLLKRVSSLSYRGFESGVNIIFCLRCKAFGV